MKVISLTANFLGVSKAKIYYLIKKGFLNTEYIEYTKNGKAKIYVLSEKEIKRAAIFFKDMVSLYSFIRKNNLNVNIKTVLPLLKQNGFRTISLNIANNGDRIEEGRYARAYIYKEDMEKILELIKSSNVKKTAPLKQDINIARKNTEINNIVKKFTEIYQLPVDITQQDIKTVETAVQTDYISRIFNIKIENKIDNLLTVLRSPWILVGRMAKFLNEEHLMLSGGKKRLIVQEAWFSTLEKVSDIFLRLEYIPADFFTSNVFTSIMDSAFDAAIEKYAHNKNSKADANSIRKKYGIETFYHTLFTDDILDSLNIEAMQSMYGREWFNALHDNKDGIIKQYIENNYQMIAESLDAVKSFISPGEKQKFGFVYTRKDNNLIINVDCGDVYQTKKFAITLDLVNRTKCSVFHEMLRHRLIFIRFFNNCLLPIFRGDRALLSFGGKDYKVDMQKLKFILPEQIINNLDVDVKNKFLLLVLLMEIPVEFRKDSDNLNGKEHPSFYFGKDGEYLLDDLYHIMRQNSIASTTEFSISDYGIKKFEKIYKSPYPELLKLFYLSVDTQKYLERQNIDDTAFEEVMQMIITENQQIWAKTVVSCLYDFVDSSQVHEKAKECSLKEQAAQEQTEQVIEQPVEQAALPQGQECEV